MLPAAARCNVIYNIAARLYDVGCCNMLCVERVVKPDSVPQPPTQAEQNSMCFAQEKTEPAASLLNYASVVRAQSSSAEPIRIEVQI
jgi:hypothetical protein